MLLAEFHVLIAHNAHFDNEMVPVGLIGADVDELTRAHVTWMPWASARNKMETMLRFLNVMRFTRTVLVESAPDSERFWRRMKDYGVLVGPWNIPLVGGDMIQMWRTNVSHS